MIRRSVHLNENLQRAREHQRHRESLSTTLPGFDTALSTAGKILNLTQDDLDDIMSTTDDSFQVKISRLSTRFDLETLKKFSRVEFDLLERLKVV